MSNGNGEIKKTDSVFWVAMTELGQGDIGELKKLKLRSRYSLDVLKMVRRHAKQGRPTTERDVRAAMGPAGNVGSGLLSLTSMCGLGILSVVALSEAPTEVQQWAADHMEEEPEGEKEPAAEAA